MEAVIQVQGLWKAFEGQPVLQGVDLTICRGQKVAIIGPSGCGKTVLAKHFNALLLPDRGRVVVFGQDTSQADAVQLEDIRRQIGFVFQDNALFDSNVGHDVYENVSLPLRKDPYDNPADDEDDIRRRVREVLGSVGLDPELADRSPSQLSGGQEKRVAVARAIVARPRAVIYDEPSTGLDPESASVVHDLIEHVHRGEGATIAITHSTDLMRRMGRVVFLRERRVYYDGPFQQFHDSPDPHIRSFLAEPPPSRSRREGGSGASAPYVGNLPWRK